MHSICCTRRHLIVTKVICSIMMQHCTSCINILCWAGSFWFYNFCINLVSTIRCGVQPGLCFACWIAAVTRLSAANNYNKVWLTHLPALLSSNFKDRILQYWAMLIPPHKIVMTTARNEIPLPIPNDYNYNDSKKTLVILTYYLSIQGCWNYISIHQVSWTYRSTNTNYHPK